MGNWVIWDKKTEVKDPTIDCQKTSAWPGKGKTHTSGFSDQCKSLLKKEKASNR